MEQASAPRKGRIVPMGEGKEPQIQDVEISNVRGVRFLQRRIVSAGEELRAGMSKP